MLRAFSLVTLLCWASLLTGCSSPDSDENANDNTALSDEPLALSEVLFWAYQIQNIDAPGSVEALANSRYDMLVIEPTRTDWSGDTRDFDTPGAVTQLKASLASDGMHRKLVIAYIDIGQAEDWRWYWTWSIGWDGTGDRPADWPEYILDIDPDGWEGDYPVAYWQEDWHNVILYGDDTTGSAPYGDYTSLVDEVIKSGFDGVYLDWVEGFENESVIAAAQADGVNPTEEMIQLIEDIRAYGLARNPDFVVIQQNAAALLDDHPELLDVIDAIAQEGIWYDSNASDNWNDTNGYFQNPADLTAEYIDWLDQYKAAGLPVFCCEYAIQENADTAYNLADANGYVPYVTRRSLSQLTDTPPPNLPE